MSKYGEGIFCKNCNTVWGNHYGTDCPGRQTKFVPESFQDVNECEHCGKTYQEHYQNLFCDEPSPDNPDGPYFISAEKCLPEELFEI